MSWRPAAERALLVARAQRLRADGLTHREIAERLGVERTTVTGYLSHPIGLRYHDRPNVQWSTCRDCGVDCSHDAQQCRRCYEAGPA